MENEKLMHVYSELMAINEQFKPGEISTRSVKIVQSRFGVGRNWWKNNYVVQFEAVARCNDKTLTEKTEVVTVTLRRNVT